MAKYRVYLPVPSAKRMSGSGRIIVILHDGWTGDADRTYELNKDAVDFEFEVPDGYEWINSQNKMDACSFTVSVEYSNSTGSRKDIKYLVPERVI